MTISPVNVGTTGEQTSAGAAVTRFGASPGWPASIVANRLLVAVVRQKNVGANAVQPMAMVEGFAHCGWAFVSGSGTQAVDNGNSTLSYHVRVATGTETADYPGGPGIRIYGANNSDARIYQFSKTEPYWDLPDFLFGSDTTFNTAWSATLQGGFHRDTRVEGGQPPTTGEVIDLKSGDYCLIGGASPSDSATFSPVSVSAAGITFGSTTAIGTYPTGTSIGTDGGHFLHGVPVTAGAGLVQPVVSTTASANVAGPLCMLRLRERATPLSLPQKITPAFTVEPESHGGHPPVCDGTNIYRILEGTALHTNTANTMHVLVSRDGGGFWEEAGITSAINPTGFDVEGGWTVDVPSSNHILYAFTKDSEAYWYSMNTLKAASGKGEFQIVDEIIDTGMTASGMHQRICMVRRSNGTLPIFYSSNAGPDRIAYKVRTGSYAASGSYTARADFDTSGGDVGGPMAAVGASDMTHIVYIDDTSRQVRYKTLSSSNVLSPSSGTAGTVVSNSSVAAGVWSTTNLVYTDEAGEVLSFAYPDASGNLKFRQLRGGAWQTEETITADVLVNPASAVHESATAYLTVDPDTDTIYCLWSTNSTGDVKMRSRSAGAGGSWTAETTLVTLPTDNYADWTYCNIYERGGNKVLGFTYHYGPQPDDTGVTFYGEQSLTSTEPPTIFFVGWGIQLK